MYVCMSVSWLFLSSGHINDPCKWTLQSSRAHIKYGGISLECLTESMEQADGQTDKLSVMNKYLLFTFFSKFQKVQPDDDSKHIGRCRFIITKTKTDHLCDDHIIRAASQLIAIVCRRYSNRNLKE